MPPLSHSTSAANASSDPVDKVANLLMGGEEDLGDEAEADDTPEQTEDDALVEDSDDVEELSDEPTEDEEEVDESETDNEEDEQALYEMLGVDESQLSVTDDGGFMINVKVDGKQSQHSLADVIKNYQTESSTTQKSMALADEKRQFETMAGAKAQEINQSLERNHNLAKILEQEILADYDKVDWEDLRQYDPAEWSAKRQEYATKYQKVQRLQTELAGQASDAQGAQTAQANQRRQAFVTEQRDAMLASNPTWVDGDKLQKDMGTLRSFAKDTYGFTDKDMDSVISAGVIEALKDAQSYRKGSKVAQKKLKKIAPKMQKRGKGGRYVKNQVSKLDKLTKAAHSASGANRRQLQTDAVAELLTGGI